MTNAARRHRTTASGPNPTPAAAERSTHRIGVVLLAILGVGVAVVIAHWPVLSANATTLDDWQYWTDNPLVQHPSWASAARFFREVLKPSTVDGYYQPLTMVSLVVDRTLAARPDDLRPVHRTNLVLHVLMTALILVLLYQLFNDLPVATLVALLFGVHPMAVEPIAWLTERKTLLAAVFSLASMVLYVRYVRRRSGVAYGAALAAFVLALLSKPTSTPLPALLLLLDCWPLRRFSVRTIVEKLPFFAIAGLSAIVTIISQARAGAVQMPHEQTQFRFVLTVCHNLLFYLRTMVWPVDLTLWHPYPDPFDVSRPAVLAGVIGTFILAVAAVVSLRWTRALCVGGLFFLVAVFPTLGAIGYTNMLASQKYAYLPAVGLLLVLAAALDYAWRKPATPRALRWRAGITTAALAAALLAGWRTHVEAGYWQTTERLNRHMLAFDPMAVVLRSDLGAELARQGHLAEAVDVFQTAQAPPSAWGARSLEMNWGLALKAQGKLDEAMTHFRTVLEIEPDFGQAHLQLGQILLTKRRWAEAEAHLKEALRQRPEFSEAYLDLGTALARQHKYDEAQTYLQKALEVDPRSVEALSNLALVLVKLDHVEQGITRYLQALDINPDRFEIHVNLADALQRLGRQDEAAEHYRTAIGLRADFAYSYDQLGRILLVQGRPAEAIETFEAGLRQAPDDADLRQHLAEARNGRSAAEARPESAPVP